jgi:hypothetical protein
VHHDVFRYEKFWLPLLTEISDSELRDLDYAPPIGEPHFHGLIRIIPLSTVSSRDNGTRFSINVLATPIISTKGTFEFGVIHSNIKVVLSWEARCRFLNICLQCGIRLVSAFKIDNFGEYGASFKEN